MNAPGPGRPGKRSDVVRRRQLLRLAGSVCLASLVSACSSKARMNSGSASANPPRSLTTPNPAGTTATGASLTTSSPPAPMTSHPPVLSTTSASLLCRDAWGAQPARPGGRLHSITRLTLHHEGVVLGENRNAPGRFRQDQHYHQDQLGWIDIAYHVGVDRNGNIYELRSTEIAGDTATDYDTTGHFLMLCEGDFDQEVVSEAQLHGTALAFAWAAENFGVATGTLAGHRDLARTFCPGTNLYAHLSSGDLKRRIDDLLAAGGVNLQRICGPEAAAKVAAIEGGP
jgi:hypothetical protein